MKRYGDELRMKKVIISSASGAFAISVVMYLRRHQFENQVQCFVQDTIPQERIRILESMNVSISPCETSVDAMGCEGFREMAQTAVEMDENTLYIDEAEFNTCYSTAYMAIIDEFAVQEKNMPDRIAMPIGTGGLFTEVRNHPKVKDQVEAHALSLIAVTAPIMNRKSSMVVLILVYY